MLKIVPIVEGDGEVEAVPVLLGKVLAEWQYNDIAISRAKQANGRGNLTREGGIEKFVRYASMEPGCAAVLVLLDADEDCAVRLGRSLAERIRVLQPRVSVVIVCAKCEYEAWFLASLPSICSSGCSSLPEDLAYDGDVEELRAVKGWLTRHMPAGSAYKETVHQSVFTQHLDLAAVRGRSRSFRRLCNALSQAVTAAHAGQVVVTP